MPAETLTEWEPEGPADKVTLWRQEQLQELGFDTLTSFRLANLSHVDLEKARKLIAAGCPFWQAAEILA